MRTPRDGRGALLLGVRVECETTAKRPRHGLCRGPMARARHTFIDPPPPQPTYAALAAARMERGDARFANCALVVADVRVRVTLRDADVDRARAVAPRAVVRPARARAGARAGLAAADGLFGPDTRREVAVGRARVDDVLVRRVAAGLGTAAGRAAGLRAADGAALERPPAFFCRHSLSFAARLLAAGVVGSGGGWNDGKARAVA